MANPFLESLSWNSLHLPASQSGLEFASQGGAYAEHTIDSFEVEGSGAKVDVQASSFTIKIGAGCGARLLISMSRYANLPTITPPWARETVATGMDSKL